MCLEQFINALQKMFAKILIPCERHTVLEHGFVAVVNVVVRRVVSYFVGLFSVVIIGVAYFGGWFCNMSSVLLLFVLLV